MSIVSSTLAGPRDFVLCSHDFPLDYKEGQHPDDYVEADQPIVPQCIFHHIRGVHNRLWWRVSLKLSNGKFIPISFLLDTGAPKHLYLSEKAMAVLEDDKQLKEDADLDLQYVKIFGRKCSVDVTPNAHQPANIIGLKLLKRLGLELYEDEPHFSFKLPIPFISME
jgi:hypothetical protein